MIPIQNNKAFTLIELLIAVLVIAVLMSIILPALSHVKKIAKAIVCQSNIRSTGLAFAPYCQSNEDYFPPAYTYIGGCGLNQPEEPINGICHWSGLFKTGGYLAEETFHCPEIPHGGLSPQNTDASNLDPEQQAGIEGVIDTQADRCAFTVNEAMCPRNRFELNFEGAQKPSKLVKNSRVGRLSSTILLTEWPADWRIVSGSDSNLSRSYMPVHGFRGLGKMAGSDRYDLNMVETDGAKPCGTYGNFRKINDYDLSVDPGPYCSNPARLDWAGRNHRGTKTNKNIKQSSFFYMDGHTESKSIYETIESGRFEWGDKVYSLAGGGNTPCY